jgi:superfamily II helicase
MLEKHRVSAAPLKCKQCVEKAQAEEQAAAEAKRTTTDTDERRTCAMCQGDLPAADYNRNQWNKGAGKSRCRNCVEKAVKEEAQSSQKSKQDAIQKAKDDVAKAKAGGKAAEILKTESVLSALEAEQVTGLKPVKMSAGGRGRRFGGRGRGRR